MPPELDTPTFREVWLRYHDFRRENRFPAWKPKTIEVNLRRMLAWGPETSIEAMETSIANGWRGVFEPKTMGRALQAPHRNNGSSRAPTESRGPRVGQLNFQRTKRWNGQDWDEVQPGDPEVA